MEPVLSVCLITYNHEKFVGQALEGIFNQVVNFEYEVVIADDCSKDKTREIILEYKNKYPEKVKLIFQEKNVGAAKNWFDLMAYPKTAYIAYIEGDDYWTNPYKLQQQYDFLESNKDFVIHCGHSLIESPNAELNGKTVHPKEGRKSVYTLEDFGMDSQVVSSTATYRNIGLANLPEAFNKATAGDWLLWIYLMQKTGGKVYYSEEIYGVYRIHGASAFSSLGLIANYKFYIKNMKIQEPFFKSASNRKEIKKKLNWYRTELFREYLKTGNTEEARKQLLGNLFSGLGIKHCMQLFFEYRKCMAGLEAQD